MTNVRTNPKIGNRSKRQLWLQHCRGLHRMGHRWKFALKSLPKEVDLPYEFLHIHDQELTEDVIDDVSEYLASEYGYCSKSFLVEVKATVTIHNRK